ncbi:MAG TPA: helix-turn-helix domain-containing protein [Candidatus Intestinimonas stercorigallinarum]|nr:helix-turn-helix domain-containing protein [Candidatus Intestinimonas stercorigallinarum]
MEKKTIGGFIAALRKANGMTQKELADLLNVSDKTVSRWERDDGAPDLSAIPVIAEIFGVTCDELLRGERKSPSERMEQPEENTSTPKGEKQLQRLLKATLSQYESRTYIAMGISAVGLTAAMIGNLAFLRAVLGFLLGAIFFIVSIVCQGVFVRQAFFRVEDAEIDKSELSAFKRRVIELAERSLGLTVGMIGFTFPLILADAYVGLSLDNMLLFAIPGAALFLAIFAVVCYFLNASFLKKGVYSLSSKDEAIYWSNHKRKRSCATGLAAALVVTLLFHVFGGEMLWSASALVKGTTFHDYESFVAYMEQDVPHDSKWDGWYAPAEEQVAPSEGTIFDADGNPILSDEARTETLEDANGDVVCTYVHRNLEVTSVSYSPKDGTVLPITTRTDEDWLEATSLSNLITTIYCVLYPVEVLAAFLIYFRKRAK